MATFLLFFEIAQTFMALCGSVMSFVVKKDADRNKARAFRFRFNGDRRLIAIKNCRIENTVWIVQIALAVTGVAAIWLAPPPMPNHEHVIVEEMRLMREIVFSIIVVRLGMAYVSYRLMRLSYQNWVDMAPLRARREDDMPRTVDVTPSPVEKVTELAASAQAASVSAATVAEQAATVRDKAIELEHQIADAVPESPRDDD